MKTAISLPDELFRELDARAKALKLSRSALLARAAREFLEATRPSDDPTEAWNRAIERGGQPGDDEGAKRARRRTKEILRRAKSKSKSKSKKRR
jgi:predicted transcriptional regulator